MGYGQLPVEAIVVLFAVLVIGMVIMTWRSRRDNREGYDR